MCMCVYTCTCVHDCVYVYICMCVYMCMTACVYTVGIKKKFPFPFRSVPFRFSSRFCRSVPFRSVPFRSVPFTSVLTVCRG